VIQLVTWPVRTDTSRLGDVLGWVALKRFPDAADIRQIWIRWISDGVFDGMHSSPKDLSRYLDSADKEGVAGLESINEALRCHVRRYLRSGDKRKVVMAMDYVQAAADVGVSVLTTLLREVEGVSGTAEWNAWRANDPDTSEWMQWYVFEVAKEALGDRDWLRALKNTEKMVEFEKVRRQILQKE